MVAMATKIKKVIYGYSNPEVLLRPNLRPKFKEKNAFVVIYVEIYKQKTNANIVNSRIINTRLHDALLFVNERPNSEKYKNNVLYKGPILWNSQTVYERSFQSYEALKSYLKNEIYKQTIPEIV